MATSAEMNLYNLSTFVRILLSLSRLDNLTESGNLGISLGKNR